MSLTDTTTITVPTHMVAQVEKFILDRASTNSPMDLCEEERNCSEVQQVLSHRVKKGEWFFEILFTTGEKRFVADDECDCEWLISNYLAEHDINTAYIFCRVSTKDQASSTSISLEAQEAEIRPLVPEYHRVKVFKISCSAYKKMPQLLVDIGECATTGDGIFVWRVDRLSRNIVKYLAWMEDLNDHGVELYSVDDGLYYSANKTEFIQAVLDAQKEAELLGTRVKLINKRKKQRGDDAIGTLSFGKKYDRVLDSEGNTIKKIVVPHTEEIALRDFIRESPLDATSLATHLNNHGYFKRGRKWSKGMIVNMRK